MSGSGIWNKHVEKEAQRKVGKPERYEAPKVETVKPPKSFKKMTAAEYQSWKPPVAGMG